MLNPGEWAMVERLKQELAPLDRHAKELALMELYREGTIGEFEMVAVLGSTIEKVADMIKRHWPEYNETLGSEEVLGLVDEEPTEELR